LAVDFAVWKLRGNSLLRDRPREFLLLSIWSVPVWMLFELVNLRIQNWYYVMAPWSFSGGLIFLMLAFGTVLPGVFETMELMVGVVERVRPGGKILGPALRFGGDGVAQGDSGGNLGTVRVLWSVGVMMLVLLLVFPRPAIV